MTENRRKVPLEKRKRTETSCDGCKSRKQKCHKTPDQTSCRYCQDHGIECVTTLPRKKRIYGSVEGLGTRLALLESLVKGLLPEADVSSVDEMRNLGQSLGIPLPETPEQSQEARKPPIKQDDERLMRDQQGQVQYIGPASSFFFLMKLKTLFGRDAKQSELYMFGRNPADTASLASRSSMDRQPSIAGSVSSTPHLDFNQSVDDLSGIDAEISDVLVQAFFDHIHADFPVLHEASFREAYEEWTQTRVTDDRNWLCSLLCVLILARRVAPISITADQEERWWAQVQSLLPSITFTSNLAALQALMLVALHLHNTNHRDACWTLTGSMVRIAYAIGLHRDGIKTGQAPLTRELKKQLWWTLYAFEQIQVSSHDRPSAIDNSCFSVGCPREAILGMGSHLPPDYMNWSSRLVLMLGAACRASRATGTAAVEEAYVGPLSPAAGLLRDLRRWKQNLPPHLGQDSLAALPPCFQRPIILMHVQYHYIVSLISRSALLYRAATLTKNNGEKLPQDTLSMADTCLESGRTASQLLLKLQAIGKYNAVTWWDIYYTFMSASILVLGIVCDVMEPPADGDGSELRNLLHQLYELTAKSLEGTLIPGTMHRWATVTGDLNTMALDFIHGYRPQQQPTPSQMANDATHSFITQSTFTNGGVQFVTDETSLGMMPVGGIPPEAVVPPGPDGQFRWQQLSFDEVQWNDIGNMFQGLGGPGGQPRSM
ncbi:hypothetical protein K402DRAFT_414721 [Aulographum hederae CBS 113979]|uniref:Zn(2)-C6 fungal-type domain-containing protein n=1 Tax=Aulographum hederae CBS 113979 TaxID=1176131 RepID=A0A6G1GPY1_9PEZI|nr:hypothetical protein K402DRAFT_414721 [Aulographum hederae CBS 113979]